MAKGRSARRGGVSGYRGNPYNAKAYKFTARRRAALKKAQAKSAQQRKLRVGIMAVGTVAAMGAVAYAGRNTSAGKNVRASVANSVMNFHPDGANLKKARAAVNPDVKEAVRVAGAVSPAHTPHQPGHIGVDVRNPIPGEAVSPATAPGTDGKPPETKVVLPNGSIQGDLSTYSHSDLGKQSASSIEEFRQGEINKALWQQHMGHFEKFMDPGDKGISSRIMNGQRVSRFEMKNALYRTSTNKAESGAQGIPDRDIEDLLDRMVASGTLRTNTSGLARALRKYPKATPDKTIPNSAMSVDQKNGLTPTPPTTKHVTASTPGVAGASSKPPPTVHVAAQTAAKRGFSESEHDAMFGFDVPLKPVLGIPATKGGARGVVKLPNSPGAVNLPPSTIGTKIPGTGLTPAQKGAMTRARNRAAAAEKAKAAEVAAAQKAATPQFTAPSPMDINRTIPLSDAKPKAAATGAKSKKAKESQPHAPSAAPSSGHSDVLNRVNLGQYKMGEPIATKGEWDLLNAEQKKRVKKGLEARGLWLYKGKVEEPPF